MGFIGDAAKWVGNHVGELAGGALGGPLGFLGGGAAQGAAGGSGSAASGVGPLAPLSQLPLIGGMIDKLPIVGGHTAQAQAQQHQQQQFANAQQAYAQYRPAIAEARTGALNTALSAYQPVSQALGALYGPSAYLNLGAPNPTGPVR